MKSQLTPTQNEAEAILRDAHRKDRPVVATVVVNGTSRWRSRLAKNKAIRQMKREAKGNPNVVVIDGKEHTPTEAATVCYTARSRNQIVLIANNSRKFTEVADYFYAGLFNVDVDKKFNAKRAAYALETL